MEHTIAAGTNKNKIYGVASAGEVPLTGVTGGWTWGTKGVPILATSR